MKKLLLLTALAIGGLSAGASVTDSFVNSQQGTDVVLPEGWEFKNQSAQSYSGVNGGLYFNGQSSYSGPAYLISPKLYGDVTITFNLDEGYDDPWGWGSEDAGSLFVYTAVKDGNTYTINTGYSNALFRSYETGLTTNTFTVPEETQIAFDIEYGAIISVTYNPVDENAEPDAYMLTLSNFSAQNNGKFLADENGNVAISYNVNVKNTGSETLTPSTPGLTFTAKNGSAGNLCQMTWTGDVTSIAPQETKTITLTGSFPIGLITATSDTPASNGAYWTNIILNSSYSTSAPNQWVDVYPWSILYRLSKSGSVNEITSADFGFVTATTNTYELQLVNLGARELTVTEISTPIGFSVNLEAPFTLQNILAQNVDRTANLVITADMNLPGMHNGTIEMAVADLDEPITLKVNSIVPGGNEYFVDFEDGQAPAGWIINPDLTFVNDGNLGSGNTKALANSTSTYTYRAITPLLHFNEGEKLAFQAYSKFYSSDTAKVTVYTSPNRSEWTQAGVVKYNGTDPDYSFPGRYESYSSYYSALGTYFLNMPEGDIYVAFDICYAGIDNIYGGELVEVAHDLMYTSTEVPTQATVNYQITPALTIKNYSATNVEEADSYEMVMLVDGTQAVTIEATPEIGLAEAANFEFPYTFHQSGAHEVIFEFRADDFVLASDSYTINVRPESSSAAVTVGTGTDIAGGYGSYLTPFDFYNMNSVGMVLYTQEYLAQYGIVPGTIIAGVSYNGYLKTAKNGLSGKLGTYIIPTELETLSTGNYDALYNQFTSENKYFYADDAPEASSSVSEIFRMDFDRNFVYNGGNIIIGSTKEWSAWTGDMHLITDTSLANLTLVRGSDSGLNLGTISASKGFPQTNFIVVLAPATYSGTVVNAETQAPVADATITLTSDNVMYTGTSDAEGAFSIDVIQASKDYEVAVAATGYDDYAGTASFPDGNVEATIELTPSLGDGVGSVNADKVNVRIAGDMIFVDGVDEAVLAVYNTAGQLMSRAEAASISIANLNAGVYVLNVKSANGTASVKFVKR